MNHDLKPNPEAITVEELAASVALELNQPLTNIAINASACLQFLSGDAPNVDEAREAVQEIIRDAQRACEAFFRVQALNHGNSLREGKDSGPQPRAPRAKTAR